MSGSIELKKEIRWALACLVALLCLWGRREVAFGADSFCANSGGGLDRWLESEQKHALESLLTSVSPPGAMRGAVYASPSRDSPNYYYNWVRDGALVMDALLTLAESARGDGQREVFFKHLYDYVKFSRHIQNLSNLSGGLGEPKFQMDGTPYNEAWGRPQNDGPALRALTLIRLAQNLLESKGKEPWVRAQLYDGLLPSQSVIKADLEYVSHHWRDRSYDLWEEVYGAHFYTRMVQRKALVNGAALAEQLGDLGAAVWYRAQAKELEIEIDKHWSPTRGYILETLDRGYGGVNKESGLDVAVLLGVIHGLVRVNRSEKLRDGFYTITDDRVLATAHRLQERFQRLYPINSNSNSNLAPAIGRYPEDKYDGYTVGGALGNPWVLATNAYAEFYFRLIAAWAEEGVIHISALNLPFFIHLTADSRRPLKLTPGQTFIRGSSEFDELVNQAQEAGDAFLARVKFHAAADGSLSEQINRKIGFMQGARDLDWSYVSFLTAYWKRQGIVGIAPH